MRLVTDRMGMPCRLFRKVVQQGRNERRGESYSVLYVESLSDERTPLAAFVNSLIGYVGGEIKDITDLAERSVSRWSWREEQARATAG